MNNTTNNLCANADCRTDEFKINMNNMQVDKNKDMIKQLEIE